MSDKAPKEGKAKKGGNKMVLIGGAVALLAVGGGGGFAAMKMMGGGEAKVKEDNRPKLIRKGEEDPYAPKKEGEAEGASADVEGDGGDEYRTAYYTFADEFTSNLKDSTALVQMSIACSTRYDGRVLLWLKKHELAIRSQILTILADTPENDVDTLAGKDHLQKRMTAAINKVLTDKEGFGGVDAVYFRTFIVQ